MEEIKCAVYTRKSTDEGLEKEFNTLEAQREAGENYVKSQKHQGWVLIKEHYDDGGFSGGNMNRPSLKRLLQDVEAGKVNMIVVYKIDRLTRSLTDFAKMVDIFDKYKCSFVSVTQNFNTADSMGRLTLNMLLSFAQFEREISGERIRDKVAASKKKGIWMGGDSFQEGSRDWKGSRVGLYSYNTKEEGGSAWFDSFEYKFDGPGGLVTEE